MIKKLLAFTVAIAASAFIFASPSFAATHTVQSGETLFSIAPKYNISATELKKKNKLTSNNLTINQVLQIPEKTEKVSATHPSNVKKTFKMTATAYTANCKGCSGITTTGLNLRKNPDLKVIAVDPKIIPLGSKVWVEGYGIAVAGDTGGSIKGNKIDIFVKSKSKAYNWGRKKVTVKLLKS
ncbi:3D domain-containing protein [Solibacillus daqui]|uniref:3D domain-containing protein n=1 Tax=Solibacillus daqui TaxID=2912187 RepID=UPI002365098C|nr:3D domain-containing protein [Solibacillus daqui]